MYRISDPKPHNIFGNQKEGVREKGFRARVENRGATFARFAMTELLL